MAETPTRESYAMPILIKYTTLRIGLLRRERQTDLVTLNDDGTICFYLATIDNYYDSIELHDGLPEIFVPITTVVSDSDIEL